MLSDTRRDMATARLKRLIKNRDARKSAKALSRSVRNLKRRPV